MSRRTQLTTKYLFSILSQLSENFIFIYLGLSLFTESHLQFNPMFTIVAVFGICAARYCAVFPLSRGINWFLRKRAERRGHPAVEDELPWSYQAMLFWAGLRGAVGVALAAGLTGPNAFTLKATVLVVVVLTVIIFGGTTARMLEILGIKTGVVEEIDSDDEFDIEAISGHSGGFIARGGAGLGNIPTKRRNSMSVQLGDFGANGNGNSGLNPNPGHGGFASGATSPNLRQGGLSRKNSVKNASETELLDPDALSDEESDSDLPPAARRSPLATSNLLGQSYSPAVESDYPTGGERTRNGSTSGTAGAAGFVAGLGNTVQGAGAAVSHLLSGTSDDHAEWFRALDEGFIKPTLLLDGGRPRGPPPH